MLNRLTWPHQHNHLKVILKGYYDLQILTFYYIYLLRYVLLKLKNTLKNSKSLSLWFPMQDSYMFPLSLICCPTELGGIKFMFIQLPHCKFTVYLVQSCTINETRQFMIWANTMKQLWCTTQHKEVGSIEHPQERHISGF